MVTLEEGAGAAICSFLEERGQGRPLRIELQSGGCCDAVLGLRLDKIRAGDLVEERGGIIFIIDAQTSRLVGDVTITFDREDPDRKGFILTSTKPVSEWSGFGICTIRD